MKLLFTAIILMMIDMSSTRIMRNNIQLQYNQRQLMSMPGAGGAAAGGDAKKDEKDPKIVIVELKQKKEMLKRKNSIDDGTYIIIFLIL